MIIELAGIHIVKDNKNVAVLEEGTLPIGRTIVLFQKGTKVKHPCGGGLIVDG